MITMREQFLAESKGVKDCVKWLNKRIKEKKTIIEERSWPVFDAELSEGKAVIAEMVSIKIGLEKYAKQLKHMADEVL